MGPSESTVTEFHFQRHIILFLGKYYDNQQKQSFTACSYPMISYLPHIGVKRSSYFTGRSSWEISQLSSYCARCLCTCEQRGATPMPLRSTIVYISIATLQGVEGGRFQKCPCPTCPTSNASKWFVLVATLLTAVVLCLALLHCIVHCVPYRDAVTLLAVVITPYYRYISSCSRSSVVLHKRLVSHSLNQSEWILHMISCCSW